MRHRLRFAKAENVLLAENKRHQSARYHAWSLYHHDAIYTFIPKNACTTLRFSVAVDNGFLDHGSDPAWLDNNNPTFSAASGFLVTARYSFVVLRCPFQRLAAAFLDKMLAPNPAARRFLAVADPTIKIAAEADRRLDQLTFADTVALMEESPADLFTPALIDRVARFYSDDIRLYKEKFGGEGLLFPV